MGFLIKVTFLTILGVAAIYLVKRLIYTSHTISEISDKKNIGESPMNHQGIVFNKETKTLEDDNSIIEPFKYPYFLHA